LVTAGRLAEVVRKLIPSADIQIGSGLSEADMLEIRYRGVLSIENARQQLSYEPEFGDIEKGVRNYADVYRQYMAEHGE